jgi:hypothetical protein
VVDLLTVADINIETSKARAQFMNHITRGCQERRSRTIRRSILQTVGIMETREIMKITNNNPHSRRRRGHSAALMMQRSGVSFIAPQDMICRSARLFWIAR